MDKELSKRDTWIIAACVLAFSLLLTPIMSNLLGPTLSAVMAQPFVGAVEFLLSACVASPTMAVVFFVLGRFREPGVLRHSENAAERAARLKSVAWRVLLCVIPLSLGVISLPVENGMLGYVGLLGSAIAVLGVAAAGVFYAAATHLQRRR